VVDDEPLLLAAVRRMLTAADLEVHCFESAAAASSGSSATSTIPRMTEFPGATTPAFTLYQTSSASDPSYSCQSVGTCLS